MTIAEDAKVKPAAKKRTIKKPSVRKGKQLNSTEKAEAVAMWRSGQFTLDQIAAKLDRSRLTFIRLFNVLGVAKGENSAASEKKITEAVEAAVVGNVAEIAERIKDTKEDHYKMASGIAKLVWNLIAVCKKEGKSFQTIGADLKALRYASAILKTSREEKYALLGLNEKEDDSDKDPEDLVIREITAAEIRDRANSQVNDDDFGPDLEDIEVEDRDLS